MSLSDREEEVGMSFSPNKHFIASDEVAGLKKDTSVDSIRYKARSQDDEEEEESVQLTMGKKQGSVCGSISSWCELVRIGAGETYYTVEDAVNELGFGPFQILVTVFCGMIWVSQAAGYIARHCLTHCSSLCVDVGRHGADGASSTLAHCGVRVGTVENRRGSHYLGQHCNSCLVLCSSLS